MFGKPWRFESLRSLKSSKICKVGKMTPSGALYRGRNWVGVIPPKIWREMSTVGSPLTPTQNLKRNVSCRISISLQDVGYKAPSEAFNETLWPSKRQNGCRTRKVVLSHVEVKEMCGINMPKSKPHFSPKKKKTWSFGGPLWDTRIQIRYLCHVSYPWPRSPLLCWGAHMLKQ